MHGFCIGRTLIDHVNERRQLIFDFFPSRQLLAMLTYLTVAIGAATGGVDETKLIISCFGKPTDQLGLISRC